MQIISTSRLVDAFMAWGSHEAHGRYARFASGDEQRDDATGQLAALEFVLHGRSPLIGRIMAALPYAVLRVRFVAEDLPMLYLANGKPASALVETPDGFPEMSVDHVRKLANAPARVQGPLICGVWGSPARGGAGTAPATPQTYRLHPPFCVYDGWHRLAAWAMQQQKNPPYPIDAYLVMTKRSDRLFAGQRTESGNLL